MYNPSESKLDTISWEDLEKEFPEITKSAVYMKRKSMFVKMKLIKDMAKMLKKSLLKNMSKASCKVY